MKGKRKRQKKVGHKPVGGLDLSNLTLENNRVFALFK
jgi:hypothetical protein